MPRTKATPRSEWMSREALPPDALIRLDHAGEWVAWDYEMTRAVATGPDPVAVRAAAIASGVERPVLEWVPPVSVRPDGDAG